MILKVTEVEHYTDTLFRIRTDRPPSFRFSAGEFVMINLEGTPKRAYSLTSGPYDEYLEFYSIKVPDGALTKELQHIKVGDDIEMGERTSGTLTLANIELGGNLWMFATGTGIAPFISLLRDPETFERFNTVNLAWSARTRAELKSYHKFLLSLDGHFSYYPTVTQDEPALNVLSGRITDHIDNDVFWKFIRPDSDKVMVCGNMDFNNDMKKRFVDIGFNEGNKKSAGTFLQEKAFVG